MVRAEQNILNAVRPEFYCAVVAYRDSSVYYDVHKDVMVCSRAA